MEFQNDNVPEQNRTEKELQDIINQLTKEKEQLALDGRYLEAESIKNKINELKQNLNGKKKVDLTNQHAYEMQNLEDNYNKEIDELNQKWDNLFLEFSDRARKIDEEMSVRHKAEMDELINILEAKLPKQIKFSREYLDLKQSEMNLVKQERYIEAHLVKTKCDALERSESEKHNKDRGEKFRNKTDQLNQKHNLERTALKQKLDTEYDMMRKQKEDESMKISLKFKNRKMDLELQQRQEKNLTENENMLKAKHSANKLAQTHKNFSKYSPQKFKLYTSESRMKEISKSLRKSPDEDKFISALTNGNHANGIKNNSSSINDGFSYRNPVELEYDNVDVNLQKDTADFVALQDDLFNQESIEEGNQAVSMR